MKKTLSLLLVFTGLSAYAQKSLLRLNLQKDSTYYINCNIKVGIDQYIKGTHHVAQATVKGTTAHKILGINDSLYNMEVTYKSMSITFDTGDHEIEFSSEKDTSNVFSRLFRLVLNRPFSMVMNKMGKIIEVKGFDKIFTDQIADLKLSEQQKKQMISQMEQSFGDSNLKNNLQAAFIMYPEQPIGVKDSWTSKTHYETAIGSIEINNVYRLSNISGNNYEIAARADILPDKVTNFMHSGTIYMRNLNMQGFFNYSIKIDKTTCWLSEVKTIKHITGKAELKHNLTDTQSLVYPFTIDGTTDVKGW
ncbi:MAG: DUF6263 family protein [Mucilaginibacter sp.]